MSFSTMSLAGPRCVRNVEDTTVADYSGVISRGGVRKLKLPLPLKYLEEVRMPKHLDGSLPDCTETNDRLSSLLHDCIDGDGAMPGDLKEATTGLVSPMLINAMKGSEMHQYFCEAYVSNFIELLKPDIIAKIKQEIDEYDQSKLLSSGLALSPEWIKDHLSSAKEEHMKNALRRAEDELAALGNLMLVTAAESHLYKPTYRFLFSDEVHKKESKKRKAPPKAQLKAPPKNP